MSTDWQAMADAEEQAAIKEHEERERRRAQLLKAGLNLDDPMVAEMAERNHRPEEFRLMGGDFWVICGECKANWPCAVRLELRERGGR